MNFSIYLLKGLIGFLFLTSATAIAQNTNVFPLNGNVGIGTTSPTSQLHVVGNSRLDGDQLQFGNIDLNGELRIWNFSASGTPRRLLGIEYDGKIVPMGSSTARLHYLEVDSGIKVGDSSIHILHSTPNSPYNQIHATNGPLYCYASDGIFLSPGIGPGRVGIGYGQPNIPIGPHFSVRGNSFFEGTSGILNPVATAIIGVAASPNEVGINVQHHQTTANGYSILTGVKNSLTKAFSVELNDNNPNPQTFLVLGNGITNIGRGAYQTGSQLFVQTDLDVACRVKSTNNNPGRTAYLAEVPRSDAKAISILLNDNNPFPETFQVLGNGITNIGRGASQSTSQLYVQSAFPKVCHVKLTSTSPGQIGFYAEVNRHDAKVISILNTASTLPAPLEVFRVDGGGVAWMKEIRVRATPFPDYVFEEGYKLMSLDSLEKYVHAHHKLPGMPSAEEIEQNDANLGELVRLQQEKIEELTLYLIQLKRKIDESSGAND